ncbi:Ligand-gated ion channel 4 [Seminavis robusta]|uniref:Ligand-gated ion channel 4 n=1 Tax=Seminavis robusta TaxID=568900 RepID=A0A9N8D802_9STRA|nr:Ligand-gated ion channel 4 [Seminavis robusta]|eukprot:Sro34_g021900.1 Ligand-gated ion channel 4 (1092) ;mRNA; f:39466-43365
MKNQLEEAINFSSSTCVFSEADEASATRAVLDLKLENPDWDIHVVASLLTRNHCDNQDLCRQVNPGDKYLMMLMAGVKGWFLEAEPDYEALGIDRTASNIQSTELFPDNAHGGNQVAREFCRIGASIAPANIAVLYGPEEAAHSTIRIQSFTDGLQEYCAHDNHTIKYSYHAGWSAQTAAKIMSPIFFRDASIDAVIAANDDMALGALVAAREMQPDRRLLVAGYDANPYTWPLLQTGAMFATVDQIPPTGLIHTLTNLLSDKANGAADFGAPTNCSLSPDATCTLDDYNMIQAAVWQDLTTQLSSTVSTPVNLEVKDQSSLLLRERLQLYNRAVRPPNPAGTPTPVRARMVETNVLELYTGASSILAQGVLVMTWVDTRLAWSQTVYPNIEYIHLSIDKIWSPVVTLSNLLKSGVTVPMTDIQTTLYPDGTVLWKQTVNTGEFHCSTIEDEILKFPFDPQNCGIDLTSYSVTEVTLVANEDDLEIVVSNNDWFQGPSDVSVVKGDGYETIKYRVDMDRDPLFTVLSIIVPSFLLNTISFAQHWIPTRTGSINLDRGGMAITTILAALALRDTMVAEVGNAFTLLDLFLLVSLVFQFMGFLITTYESSYGRIKTAKNDNELGWGDRLGKVVTPIVFGLFCFSLSIYWGDGLWILSYLGAILVVLSGYLGRRDRELFKQKMAQRYEKSKLSRQSRRKALLLARSYYSSDEDEHSSSTDGGVYLKNLEEFNRRFAKGERLQTEDESTVAPDPQDSYSRRATLFRNEMSTRENSDRARLRPTLRKYQSTYFGDSNTGSEFEVPVEPLKRTVTGPMRTSSFRSDDTNEDSFRSRMPPRPRFRKYQSTFFGNSGDLGMDTDQSVRRALTDPMANPMDISTTSDVEVAVAPLKRSITNPLKSALKRSSTSTLTTRFSMTDSSYKSEVSNGVGRASNLMGGSDHNDGRRRVVDGGDSGVERSPFLARASKGSRYSRSRLISEQNDSRSKLASEANSDNGQRKPSRFSRGKQLGEKNVDVERRPFLGRVSRRKLDDSETSNTEQRIPELEIRPQEDEHEAALIIQRAFRAYREHPSRRASKTLTLSLISGIYDASLSLN